MRRIAVPVEIPFLAGGDAWGSVMFDAKGETPGASGGYSGYGVGDACGAGVMLPFDERMVSLVKFGFDAGMVLSL
jgi:hypothetical protein